jgi:hypothetical protein
MKISAFLIVFVLSLNSFVVLSQDTASHKKKLKAHVSKGGTSRFLLRVYGGYGLAIGNNYDYFSEKGNITDNFSETYTDLNYPNQAKATVRENTRGLGTGPRVGIGLGYIVNDYINLGLDIDYFSSEISKTRRDVLVGLGTGTPPFLLSVVESDFSYKGKVVRISPNVVFKAIAKNSAYIYNRLGVSITPFYKLERVDKSHLQFSSGGRLLKDSTVFEKYNITLKLPIGFYASVGVNFKISGTVRLFSEVQYTSIIFAPNKKTIVEYTENNVNLLDSKLVSTYVKEDVFTKEFNINTNPAGPPDLSQPRRVPAIRVPVTNFSFLTGLSFRF